MNTSFTTNVKEVSHTDENPAQVFLLDSIQNAAKTVYFVGHNGRTNQLIAKTGWLIGGREGGYWVVDEAMKYLVHTSEVWMEREPCLAHIVTLLNKDRKDS